MSTQTTSAPHKFSPPTLNSAQKIPNLPVLSVPHKFSPPTLNSAQKTPNLQVLPTQTTSAQENAHAKPLNAAMMNWFWHQYLENESQGREPYAAPMHTTDLSSLPRATVITAEFAPLRDEGEAYARRLLDVGVPVFAKRYGRVTHEFFGLAGAVPTAKQAVEYTARGSNWFAPDRTRL